MLNYIDAHTWIRWQTDWHKSLRGFWRTLCLLNSTKGRFFLNRMNKHRKCVRIIHRGQCCVLHSVPVSRTTVARLRNHGNTSFYLMLFLDNWLQVWDLYKRGDRKKRERMRGKKITTGGKKLFPTFTNVWSSYKSPGLNKFQSNIETPFRVQCGVRLSVHNNKITITETSWNSTLTVLTEIYPPQKYVFCQKWEH